MKGRTRSRKKSAIASGESQTLMHVTSPSDSHATDTTRAGGGSVTMRSRASHSSNSSRGATTRSTNTRASSHLPDVLRGRSAFGWPVRECLPVHLAGGVPVRLPANRWVRDLVASMEVGLSKLEMTHRRARWARCLPAGRGVVVVLREDADRVRVGRTAGGLTACSGHLTLSLGPAIGHSHGGGRPRSWRGQEDRWASSSARWSLPPAL